ncbi:MAG: hypothetical protein GKR95_25325 [Gammaproteobacteria bacterium]|nr:hypothetical protein [Gammaproteobacteria bacterium]
MTIMAFKFHFLQIAHEPQTWGDLDHDLALQMRLRYLQSEGPHEIVDTPEEADIILFWDPHQDSQIITAPRLRQHPLVHRFPEKVFTVSGEDYPLGFLPGLYCSLSKRLFQPDRHKTWFYHRTPNPACYQVVDNNQRAPGKLASFTGANSHALRSSLFNHQEQFRKWGIDVRETPRNRFNSNPGDPVLKREWLHYVDTILDAKFSLCPRGNGPASYRLQETMALGRVPVLISDDWPLVDGLDWGAFTIRIGENEIASLPDVLTEYEPRWREMGEQAREVYQNTLSGCRFVENVVDRIAGIYHSRTHDERDYIAKWPEMIEKELRYAVLGKY